ncbi:hypothetical protein C1645_878278 [Glomus cerebriforme]|uniref:Uncharacterized protein n=1 Tax=Glomus cerebriforme TaxID=658196 RepID=A0A397SM06_9GLOM|nr:hypothetical protein C1645_878278 [Glomus cerebriforme]
MYRDIGLIHQIILIKIVWPSYVKANKHILDKIEKGEERLKNLTRKIDDLIILESDHISTLSKNVETAVMTVLGKKKSLD